MFRILDLYDLIALVGLALVGVGVWWISPAASLITVGGLLLGVSLIGALRRGRG